MTLHIFNPDTDYALASNRRYYTPPAHIVALRKELALLPALYARNGDAILLVDDDMTSPQSLRYFVESNAKKIRIISMEYLKKHRSEFKGCRVMPWGWNRSIRQFVLDNFDHPSGVPDENRIEALRNLSHRRTTITMHHALAELIADEIEPPKEIFSAGEALEYFCRNRSLFFKAPWSSSGRGIMLTDDLEPKHVEPWIRGIISRQGSVMMEKAYPKKLDFATEWQLDDGKVEFLGYSVFNTSRRGKYHGNVTASQAELESIIAENAPCWNKEWLNALQNAVSKVIGADYSGPLGVDMLVTEMGNVNPCVELNLRMTMGMAALKNFTI